MEIKKNSKLLTNSLGKNVSHRPSTALQDLQKTLWISPLLLSWTLALLKNHVLKIFLAFFNLRHLKNKLWLPAHILSEIYKLLESFNSFNSLDLFFIAFLLFITLYFSFLLWIWWWHFLFFLRRRHASRSSGYTSFPVKDSTLQTSPSNSLFDTSLFEELGRSQSFLFSNIDHCPGIIAPNQYFVCVIMNCRVWKSATKKNTIKFWCKIVHFFFLSDHLFFQTSYQKFY